MRNANYERQWLEAVCKHAGLSGLTERFSEAVYGRLTKGAGEYGENGFLDRAGSALVSEVAEEATDLAAWALLLAQRLQIDPELGEEDTLLIQARLVEAAAYSLRAWSAVSAVRDLYREAPRRTVLAGRPPSQYFED